MQVLSLKGIEKWYGDVHAVKGVDLEVEPGSFLVLVGPSGCGKSTLLRVIAGLERLEEGTVEIGGRTVTYAPPGERGIAMVFQNYALYPYMTVGDNLRFPLKMRNMASDEMERRVSETSRILGISELLARYPRQLSGGQRQRVAMGRALVRDAELFLFDEPLSNLDAQLRDEMRTEIKRLHQQLQMTVVYVTHDQIEAMTLADRVILMRDGRIEQSGTPEELYNKPASEFVARFIGSPQINFLEAECANGGHCLVIPGASARACDDSLKPRLGNRKSVKVGIRPEHFTLANGSSDSVSNNQIPFDAEIELVEPTGARSYVIFKLGDVRCMAEVPAQRGFRAGDRIGLNVAVESLVLIDPDNGMAL